MGELGLKNRMSSMRTWHELPVVSRMPPKPNLSPQSLFCDVSDFQQIRQTVCFAKVKHLGLLKPNV